MLTMNDVFLRLGKQLDLNPLNLLKYNQEDELKGYYDGGGPFAIPYAVDGQLLYSLIRALKPKRVLEIGTAQGGSARHILEALDKNKNGGLLVAIDIDQNATLNGIPHYLRKNSVLIIDEASEYLTNQIKRGANFDFDFIHEDGAHSVHLVHAVYGMLPNLMPKGGVIVSHDIGTGVADNIRTGISKAGFELPPEYVYDGSPCGFTVMEYKGVR